MLALVAKKKLSASARSLGLPAALAPLSNSCNNVLSRVKTVSLLGLGGAANRFAISRVLSCVPVERKRTAASLNEGGVSCAAVVVPVSECFAPSLFSSRCRANRSMTMLVIVALAGLFQLPPRRSEYWAAAGPHVTRTNVSKKQKLLE